MTEKEYQLEQYRQVYKRKFRWNNAKIILGFLLMVVCGPLIVLLPDAIWNVGEGMLVVVIVLLLMAFVFTLIFMFWIRSKKIEQEYVICVKKACIASASTGMFDEFYTTLDGGISKDEFKELGFVKSGFLYSEDLCYGICNGITFRMADCYSHSGGRYNTAYFKGQWIEFEYPKMQCDLLLIPNSYRGEITKRTSIFTSSDIRRHAVLTNDSDFDSTFQCLCHEDCDINDLLTAEMRQRLMQLEYRFDGQFLFAYNDGRIYILLNNMKDLMQISPDEPVNEERIVKEFHKDLLVIPTLIEELGFNEEAVFFNENMQDIDKPILLQKR